MHKLTSSHSFVDKVIISIIWTSTATTVSAEANKHIQCRTNAHPTSTLCKHTDFKHHHSTQSPTKHILASVKICQMFRTCTFLSNTPQCLSPVGSPTLPDYCAFIQYASGKDVQISHQQLQHRTFLIQLHHPSIHSELINSWKNLYLLLASQWLALKVPGVLQEVLV